jgi:hypothetical protein
VLDGEKGSADATGFRFIGESPLPRPRTVADLSFRGQQIGELGDVRRDPPRLVFAE